MKLQSGIRVGDYGKPIDWSLRDLNQRPPECEFRELPWRHLTLREEHRLRVFENKVLRKIFGAKKDEITGEWRKLHNAELHALYSSTNIIRSLKSRRLRWARSTYGAVQKCI